MPTGLGWFVTTESGQRLVWTFGHIPERELRVDREDDAAGEPARTDRA